MGNYKDAVWNLTLHHHYKDVTTWSFPDYVSKRGNPGQCELYLVKLLLHYIICQIIIWNTSEGSIEKYSISDWIQLNWIDFQFIWKLKRKKINYFSRMKLKRLLIMQLHKVQNNLEQNTVYSLKYNLQLAINGETWHNINMWHIVTQPTLESHPRPWD